MGIWTDLKESWDEDTIDGSTKKYGTTRREFREYERDMSANFTSMLLLLIGGGVLYLNHPFPQMLAPVLLIWTGLLLLTSWCGERLYRKGHYKD